ncbi:MAG: glutamate-semialdehyde -aminomutase [Acidimicrobiaceae bacterium]|nr:glutamate-semialdehyde -aminomutase [Acidimicrobiaceae bacterium]
MTSFEASRRRVEQGAAWLTHGVGSDFRLGMSPHPLVIERAEGPYLFDADGNRLIDYYLGMGPMVLGHRPAEVVDAVVAALGRGVLVAGQTDLEYEAARLVTEMVPCAESVRFGSSGSEVVHAALRLARGVTGRETVVKFEGHYHGWFDTILWSTAPSLDEAGPRETPHRVAGSAGQDPAAGEHVDVLAWNDLDLLAARVERGDVAAVIMEAAMCNTSAVPPAPGYLEGVRELCDRTGTILIFDEVITGFRLAPGGAQELLGVTPDLATFGKALASGFPIAALAGRRHLMEQLSRAAGGTVMHAGTYNGGLPVAAATVATLQALRQPSVFGSLAAAGERLRSGITSALARSGIPFRVQGWPQVFHVALGTSDPITDYRTSLAADKGLYVKLCTALLERGVRALERGAWFVSTTHDDAVIDQTVAAFEDALAVVA